MAEYETIIKKIKDSVIDRLKGHDWLENMTQKCRTYIEYNSAHITEEEIGDILFEEAFKTFPIDLKDKVKDEIKQVISDVVYLGDEDDHE